MSEHAHTGTLGHALRSAGVVTPRERLDATARRILAAQPPERRASALLTVLAADLPALWELMQPVAMARAEEFMRSLAVEVGEGEGHQPVAEQARHRSPSPNQSPQGGDADHAIRAERATRTPSASQHSAQAEGREGQAIAAEQAKAGPPSRPAGNIVPVAAHLRSKPGTAAPRPLAIVIPPAPNEPKADIAAITAARRVAFSSLLTTFRIGDVPLGEATPEMCRTFIKKRRRDAAFIERVIQGVPDGRRIAAYVTEGEAAEFYREATREVFNV